MTRKTKISCDVTREADNMLKAYCLKHERSKGYLIEKMIRKFCGEQPAGSVPPAESAELVAVKAANKVKRFVPPTLNQVREYMFEKNDIIKYVEADKFHDFYESNGWKVGKNKMKCWKAAVRNWLKSNSGNQSRMYGKTSGNFSACKEFIDG